MNRCLPRPSGMRPPRRPVAAQRAGGALLGAVAGLGVACTHYVSRGSDLYFQGRYIEAAHVLEKTESRLQSAELQERAQYGLYRGATLRRLGDLPGAERWLGLARESVRRAPGLLSRKEQELLEETWIALQAQLERQAAPKAH